MKTAKIVLGLWSRNAFRGRWVRIESRIGLDQRKLVAAMIDGTRPEELPAEFYNVNVESLADFYGQPDHEGWNRVLLAIGKRLGRSDLAPRAVAGAAPRPAAAPAATAGSNNGLMWAIGGAAAAAIVLLLFMRGGDGAKPPATAPMVASQVTSGVTGGGGPAIPVPKPDDPSPSDGAAQEAARVQRACEGGDIDACSTYLQRYPGSDFSRIAAQRAIARQTPQPPAEAVAADLSGAWQGYYQQNANRTPFAVEIAGRAGSFRGRMAETNTFADRNYPQLFANIAGETRADGAVAFVKTYDGTAGVSHSVQYQGRIDDAGRTIRGVWRIRDAASGQEISGQFAMERR